MSGSWRLLSLRFRDREDGAQSLSLWRSSIVTGDDRDHEDRAAAVFWVLFSHHLSLEVFLVCYEGSASLYQYIFKCYNIHFFWDRGGSPDLASPP